MSDDPRWDPQSVPPRPLPPLPLIEHVDCEPNYRMALAALAWISTFAAVWLGAFGILQGWAWVGVFSFSWVIAMFATFPPAGKKRS